MLRRTLLKTRAFSLSTNSRATLDELLRHPILERENADPDTLQDLDAFPVPILPRQVSESLRREFGYPILTRTEWEFAPKTLEEVRGDWWRAARLIHETLAVWRNRPGTQSNRISPLPRIANDPPVASKMSKNILMRLWRGFKLNALKCTRNCNRVALNATNPLNICCLKTRIWPRNSKNDTTGFGGGFEGERIASCH